jgi:hypothetical protein
MEVTRPRATLAGVPLCFASNLQQSLHACGLLEWVQGELGCAYQCGKELMKLKHVDNLKPLSSTVNKA